MKKPVFSQAIGGGLVITALGSAVALEPIAVTATEPTGYNCLTREVFTPEKQAWCDSWKSLQNATYIVPTSLAPNPEYTKVTLNHGRYQRQDGTFIVELVNQNGWVAFGDLNNDGKKDAAVIFGVALDPDGKAVATYLTGVLDVDGKAQALTPVKLGERIILGNAMTIENGQITVPLLTATEVVNRVYGFKNDALTELAPPSISQSTSELILTTLSNGTLIFSQTSSYAVRIFTQNRLPYLNLFNKKIGKTDLMTVPVLVESTAGEITYRYQGKPSGKPSGKPFVRVRVAASGAQTIEVNGKALQDYAQITGTVTYRVRVALPANAVFEVSLVDVSRADAKAILLASQSMILADRQVPVPFELIYDPKQIDPRFRYAVQARITVDGQLRFINTSQHPVITQGNPTRLEVIVDPVSR
jgi:uncharacterized lipoprotein YbaY